MKAILRRRPAPWPEHGLTVRGRFGGVIRSPELIELWAKDADGDYFVAHVDGVLEVDLSFQLETYLIAHGDAERVTLELQVFDQLHEAEPGKFTTLDRPPPMSPEMALIHRISRQNQIERDRLLDRLRQLEHARNEVLYEDDRRRAGKAGGKAAKDDASKKPEGSGADAARSQADDESSASAQEAASERESDAD